MKSRRAESSSAPHRNCTDPRSYRSLLSSQAALRTLRPQLVRISRRRRSRHACGGVVQADITAEAAAAAREMGREALLRRLAEIGMSE